MCYYSIRLSPPTRLVGKKVHSSTDFPTRLVVNFLTRPLPYVRVAKCIQTRQDTPMGQSKCYARHPHPHWTAHIHVDSTERKRETLSLGRWSSQTCHVFKWHTSTYCTVYVYAQKYMLYMEMHTYTYTPRFHKKRTHKCTNFGCEVRSPLPNGCLVCYKDQSIWDNIHLL